MKVCDRCYVVLTGKEASRSNRQIIPSTKNPHQVILFGDFQLGMTRNRVWITLEEDFHLHIYGARLDDVEDSSINLTKVKKLALDEKCRLFTLHSRKGNHQFSIPNNHRLESSNSGALDKKLRENADALKTATDLWYTSISAAVESRLPDWWHEGKRVSSDSGYSEKSTPVE